MKATLAITTLFIILISSSFFVVLANTEGNKSSKFKMVNDGIFTFSIPITWRKMKDRELNIFKKQYEQHSAELFKQYHGRSEGYKSGVSSIIGFFSPKQEVTLVLLVMKIPAQTNDYLKQMYTRSKDVIEWGKSQGRVTQDFRNALTKFNGIPTLETDLEMSDGSRMAGYSIYSKSHPNQVLQITMLFAPRTYPKYEAVRDRIMSNIRIELLH